LPRGGFPSNKAPGYRPTLSTQATQRRMRKQLRNERNGRRQVNASNTKYMQ